MSTNDYIAPKWQSILAYNGLSDFKSIWKLEADWFETPNLRRGGWSGVNRISLNLPEGGTINVFLKRQQNHPCRTIQAPVRGIPTYKREFNNIIRFTKAGVNTLVPIYFSIRIVDNHHCAILITEELTGYTSLEDWSVHWQTTHQLPTKAQRNKLFTEIARQLRYMHKAGFKHNCLYPKHLLIRIENDFNDIDVKVIDLEKSRYYPYSNSHIRRDLYTIKKRCTLTWSMTDQIRFMHIYLGIDRLNKKAKFLCRRLIAHEQKRMMKIALSKQKEIQTS